MYSQTGQHDFASNSADFHHFSRVPQRRVLQTGNVTQWCRPKISQTSIFPFLQKNIINCSFNDKYRVWLKFSQRLKLIYDFLQLCEMFLSVVDWLVIPPHSSLLSPLHPELSFSFRLAWLLMPVSKSSPQPCRSSSSKPFLWTNRRTGMCTSVLSIRPARGDPRMFGPSTWRPKKIHPSGL